ncbi:TetR/AcrR family transcriptional regulator [Mycobacterium sp.]|uniref:TetR/AcrR family transcriptional regulator n=1 Tax=Mycobacterium sp. TaxID=1785 RepID=UPI002BC2700F|nr:TetR/AcrR family transcriptional regulator [Mycobacterium sp.]HME49296.1 TetR/AcrR family transcriptional regulator [Mycobacterium sp.]
MAVDPGSRRKEYAELTRTAILDAAAERFVADGYAATSIDAVAAAARVSKGSVYHHFSDKSELFEAVFVAMEQRLLAAVTAALATIDDLWALMAAGTTVYLEFCSQPDFRRIALQEAPVALGWTRWRAIEERFFLGLITAGLARMAEAGLIAIPPGDIAARMLLAALSEAGLAVAAAPADQQADERNHAATVAEGFLRSLGTKPHRPRKSPGDPARPTSQPGG